MYRFFKTFFMTSLVMQSSLKLALKTVIQSWITPCLSLKVHRCSKTQILHQPRSWSQIRTIKSVITPHSAQIAMVSGLTLSNIQQEVLLTQESAQMVWKWTSLNKIKRVRVISVSKLGLISMCQEPFRVNHSFWSEQTITLMTQEPQKIHYITIMVMILSFII